MDFDIAVYGSTSGAVAAAIQSARLGRKVALVSPDEHIGGIQVEGLGGTDIDNQAEFQNSSTVRGLALELHQRISARYNRSERLERVVASGLRDPDVWRFESKVAEEVISDWLKEHMTLDVIHGSLAESGSVVKNGSTIDRIVLLDGRSVTASVFIEASYEGDLLAAAGVSTVVGRESSDMYGESLNGVRAETPYRQFTAPINPYRIPGDPFSGLIFGVSPEEFGKAGQGDRHVAAYSFRVPLTKGPNNRKPITRPEGYDQEMFELHRRWARAGGTWNVPVVRVPNGKTDLIGSEAVLATDLLGMNDGWPEGNYATRVAIRQQAELFTKGLLYFMTSDPSLPASIREEWSKWGYCLDEFPDNDHFPRQLYIRDGRRMKSDYVITQHTASENGGALEPDPVGIACWPTDFHCARRVVRDGVVHNEGFVFKDGHRWRPFGIPYRSLVPRRSEVRNLITATCPSSSHVGYGAVRLEHQFYTLGQSCAHACDLALKNAVDIQDIAYPVLRERLFGDGIPLDADKIMKPNFASQDTTSK